ncbi:MAG TPA: glycosyltransferase family 4 protein [Candidatus Bilamarchaeum sp.]|nr:glycosyltransferase family 4 protein [Candidatus Bilamarchaeum sp.]
MRIALVYTVLDSISGEKVFFDNMIRGLRERGMDVVLCPVRQAAPKTLSGKFEFYSRLSLIRAAKRELGKHKVDVVHFLNSALSPAWKSARGARTIATSHFIASSYHELSPPKSAAESLAEKAYCGYVRWLDRPAFGAMDKMAACAPYQAAFLAKDYSLGNVVSILPGIDNAFFKKTRRRDLRSEFGSERVIAYVGRLHERSKGVSYLIRAMEHLDAKLVVVGDGPDEGNYRRLARELSLEGKISFSGRLGFREKTEIQKSADVMAIPSLYEAYGTVFAESLSCGVPVVAFDMPFWKGLYDGAGIFAEPRNPRALSAAIRSALEEKTRGALIRRGLETAKAHDLPLTLDSYMDAYSALHNR